MSNLPGDYYRFDRAQQRLVGERSGQTFALGAALRVLVAAVNLDERKIDLQPVALPRSARAGRSRQGPAGRSGRQRGASSAGRRRGR